MLEVPQQPLAEDAGPRPEAGIALCLSGGGYRAMVFHLGCLWRLYEAGLLQTVARVSSVSGGSITAAFLALKWRQLVFEPLRRIKRCAMGSTRRPPSTSGSSTRQQLKEELRFGSILAWSHCADDDDRLRAPTKPSSRQSERGEKSSQARHNRRCRRYDAPSL